MIKLGKICSGVLICALFLIAPAQAEEKVIALVDGSAITAAELELEVSKLIPRTYFHRDVTPERKKSARRQAFGNLLTRHLIYAWVAERDMLPDRKDVDKKVEVMEKRFSSKREFEAAVKNSGFTMKEYRKVLEREAAEEMFMKQEINEKAVPPEEQVREYYEKNKGRFVQPENLRVFHIMIPVEPSATAEEREKVKAFAGELVRRVRAGEDFSALAAAYSKDAYRVKGGDLGFVHRGRLDQAVEELAFSLKEGEIGGPVETLSGFSIVKAGEKRSGGQLSFDAVKETIGKQLEADRRKELFDAAMVSLKKRFRTEIVVPEFRDE